MPELQVPSPSEIWKDFVIRTAQPDKNLAGSEIHAAFFCGMSAVLSAIAPVIAGSLSRNELELLKDFAISILLELRFPEKENIN